MRHALLILLIPLTLLLSGCCWWGDDSAEPPYHDVRMNNHSDRIVTIRYTAVVNVWWSTDADGNDTYSYDYSDRSTDIPGGGHQDIRVPRDGSVEIKAESNHVIHWFRKSADSWCSCDLTIDMQAEDFVPVMPVANG